MFLLDYWVVILFLVTVDLSQAQNLVSWVLLFDGLNFAVIHVIDHDDFLLYEVHGHFCDLFFRRLFRVFLKLTRHFLNAYFSYVVVIVERVLSSVNLILVSLIKCDALGHQPVIAVYIQLNGLLTYFFDSFNQPIRVAVGVKVDDSHASINLCDFFPMRHFAGTIVLDSFELVGVAVLLLQLIAAVLVKIANFLDLDFLVILKDE